MKHLIFLILSILVITKTLDAQTYLMQNGQDTACSGAFYDNGGPSGNYSNSLNLTYTLHSSTSERVQVQFSSFSLYSQYDYLRIYDGPSTAYPLIGTYYGASNPGTIKSSGTALTFVFYSSYYDNSSGWAALVSCAGQPLEVFNLDNSIDTVCDAVFYDGGGAAAQYAAYENKVQTFVSATSQHIKATFNQAIFGLSSGDTLFVYDGNSTAAPMLAALIGGSTPEHLTSSGDALTFKFKSDYSNQADGWQAILSCTSTPPAPITYLMSPGTRYACNGIFTDMGGTANNYWDSQSTTTTFKSYNGNRLKMNFTQFQLYSYYDYLRIYDGPNSSYPIIGTYYGSQNPGSITSSGDALTFYFYSSAYDNSAGWQALISCDSAVLSVYNMTNTTTRDCEGVFYDNGGANNNYSDYANLVHTFVAEPGKHLSFVFNQNSLGFSGADTLFVFDGKTVNSKPLGKYYSGSTIETIVSTDSALTFKFTSDYTGNGQGWQAVFNCITSGPTPLTYAMSPGTRYVCNGIFTDMGGTAGNYWDSQSMFSTFRSYNGNRLKINFTQFQLYSYYDNLKIFDGPNSSYPLIGTYYGNQNPGSIVSSGDALTFYFYSSAYDNSTGWQALISCDSAILPVYNMANTITRDCEGVFYDNGGAKNNYTDYASLVHTFVAEPGKHLSFSFNPNSIGLAANDTLWVFDGKTVNSNPLAVYINGSTIENLVSSDSALTFKFSSNYTGNDQGWQAVFSCVTSGPIPLTYAMSPGTRYVCNGIFTDMGGTSGNYWDSQSMYSTFRSYNGNRLKMNFTQFNLYSYYDVLRIYDGPTSDYPLIGSYYSNQNPGTIISSGDALTFYFYSSSYDNSTGWQALISCDSAILPVFNMSNTTTRACEGVFYDNGGGKNNYSDYANLVHTFVAEPGKHLSFVFNPNSIALSASDTLWVFDGKTVNSNPLGIYISGSTIENLVSSDSALTFKFSSNYTGNAQGWQAVFSCINSGPIPLTYAMSPGTRYVCSGVFTDMGGTTGNYYDSQSMFSTLRSYNGNRLKVNFTQFLLYSYYDYLKIYDGPTDQYPLIGTYYYNQNPGSILSTGDALTFYFYSSSYDNSTGWQAQISCDSAILPVFNMANTSSTACSGVFYDNGGAKNNYADYSNLVHTFNSGDGTHLQFVFNPLSIGLYPGDTLWIYDGSTVNAQALGVYINGSIIETITSSGTSLTFKFKSDINNNYAGWQAIFNCVTSTGTPTYYQMSSGTRYVCSGYFTDAGGPSGNYPDGENRVQTFRAKSGNRLKMIFNQFSLYSYYDYLKIYDGPSTSSTLLGTYYYNQNPGTVISSGDALTFQFYSSSYDNAAGWNAAISCIDISPAIVITDPVSLTKCVGNSAQFVISASGAEPVTYQWYKNYVAISGATDSVYSISSVSTSNAGNYKCKVTNAYGTDSSTVATLVVNSLPSVGLSLSPVCLNTSSFTLNTGTPSGGVYTGTGVSSGIFYPQSAGVGNHNITYSYTDGNGCQNSFTASQEVKALPTVSFSQSITICQNEAPVNLTGGSPSGGTYSGLGVISGVFNPALANIGSNTLTYTYIGGNGCSNTATQSATVNSVPSATFSSLSNICSNVPSFALTQGSPSGGVYFGTGVSGGNFNAATAGSGNHSLGYIYTNSNNCKDTAYQTITVNNSPSVNLNNFSPTCDNTPSIILTGGSPAGGIYSGLTVSGGVFYPSLAGQGSYPIQYKFTNAYGCRDSITKNIVVNMSPFASISTMPNICANAAPITLNGGSPVGGIYFGNGVSNGIFDPASVPTGNQTIKYAFTNSFGCSDTAQTNFMVYSLPQVNMGTLPSNCFNPNLPALTLTQGAPAGGVYSGNYVSNGSFNYSQAPSGSHTINYTIVNPSTGCSNSASQSLTIYALPQVTFNLTDTSFCDNEPAATLTSSPSNLTYNSPSVTNGTFYPHLGTIGANNIPHTYTDANNCTTSGTLVLYVLQSPTAFAGTDTSICVGQCVTFVATGGLYYSWNHQGAATAQTTVCPTTNTTYQVNVTAANQCTDHDLVNVVVNPLPTVSLGHDTTICANHVITLTPQTNGIISIWSNGSSSTTVQLDSNGYGIGSHQIWVKATNSFGCINSDTLILTFDDCSGMENGDKSNNLMIFPNPTSDYLNIVLDGNSGINIQSISIYNTVGQEVISSEFNSSGASRIDLTKLPVGIYELKVIGENHKEIGSSKFAISR